MASAGSLQNVTNAFTRVWYEAKQISSLRRQELVTIYAKSDGNGNMKTQHAVFSFFSYRSD